MCRLILFQQGATKWEKEGRLRGRLDVPLSPQGVAAVTESAREISTLAPQVIYYGPDRAGEQTAQVLAEHTSASLRRLDALTEMGLGLWEGLLVEEVKQRHPRVYRQWRDDPERVAPPEGETLSQVLERARRTVERICGRHQRDTVAAVAPPLFEAVLRSLLGKEDLAGLMRGTVVGGRWRLYEV